MIPVGYHNARPVKAGYTVAKTGDRQGVLLFEIADGPNAGEQISKFRYLEKDESIDWWIDDLRRCGCTDPQELTVNTKQIVRIEIEHVEVNGKTFARLKGIYEPGLGKQLVGAQLDSLMARIKARAGQPRPAQPVPEQRAAEPKKVPEQRAAEPKKVPVQKVEPEQEDDFPF